MEKNELIRKMKSLDTNVALATSSFLIAVDENTDLETREMFANEYLNDVDTLVGLNVLPKEISDVYIEGKKYLQSEYEQIWKKK